MVNKQLIHPESIVVIGGSNDIQKPGGKVLKNIIDGKFTGNLYVINPKETEVQGITSFSEVKDLPQVDLAIVAIAAKYVPDAVEELTKKKNTRAFIILSAGFGEESKEGKVLESRIVGMINEVNGALIGPNCIGVLTPQYHGVFTQPIPGLDPMGCDFISGSGATACFIMEAGIPKGLRFANVFSVGNSAQIGVEEILQYLDESFDPEKSSRIKLLYVENIFKPKLLLKHATSLIRKGCHIAAVKAGASEAGSRAASSHTGALASPDEAVKALFRKAGIVRCEGREELASVASVFTYPRLKGKNIAIVTHAGGPAVMLTDALSNGGLQIPHLEGPAANALLEKLLPGSSVANPIDFLATGTAEQLGIILDAIENHFPDIDGSAVIFGTPGLTRVFDAYKIIDQKIRTARKPIFPILPSTLTGKEEIETFVSNGHTYFSDEVVFGHALTKVVNTSSPSEESLDKSLVDLRKIREIIEQSPNGYMSPSEIQVLLDAAGITRAKEAVVLTVEDALNEVKKMGFPVVMKVVGPVHKSDVAGVVLNVSSEEVVIREFERMVRIPETKAILIQQMLSGFELFAGAKREDKFGHMILCGLGGIFIEVIKDVSTALTPVSMDEAIHMIRSLKGYKILQGVRGQKGINEQRFADIIIRLSALLEAAPEISELDFNPILGREDQVVVVDARICISK
ncbi:MAG: CoA-binding protein [Bacteroidetes bacterium]|nr:CoA-binding protein [Bacteroidota bacterium]